VRDGAVRSELAFNHDTPTVLVVVEKRDDGVVLHRVDEADDGERSLRDVLVALDTTRAPLQLVLVPHDLYPDERSPSAHVRRVVV
jgi:hypothetical protein